MPLVDWDLAGDQGRSAAVAVLQDLEKVDPLSLGEDGDAPVVQDQQIDAGKALQRPAVSPVAAGQRQGLEQARNPLVED